MTIVAEEEVLTAAELDLAVDSFVDQPAATDTETGPAATATGARQQPFLVIEKGAPTDEEIAALVCVFSAAASAGAPPADNRPIDLWGLPTLLHRGNSPSSPYAFPRLAHLHA
ncbi:acyl-CoA carboxylase subunit epsilon [Nocardia donostiensis]|uniref:Acyl-CoA carboxylase subunit epsilon n=1 Tax=Nocardia donostiensis TaxID=1538463 RepID=A0A1W0B258_9NOCA|nr:acyl-CoA carboxylase subunit epsilon [Nocardia donostiensis]ONM47013.1 hypothetical protein B0T46_20090 [Nocardia donostiensis]OQS14615.1 hypothetical protein B0T36_14020 [Nocardia donostiensis]OQS16506.1 hypothetical protein B0T44_25155 [Nocardia donostiensis]